MYTSTVIRSMRQENDDARLRITLSLDCLTLNRLTSLALQRGQRHQPPHWRVWHGVLGPTDASQMPTSTPDSPPTRRGWYRTFALPQRERSRWRHVEPREWIISESRRVGSRGGEVPGSFQVVEGRRGRSTTLLADFERRESMEDRLGEVRGFLGLFEEGVVYQLLRTGSERD
jgi:hypothetical protein